MKTKSLSARMLMEWAAALFIALTVVPSAPGTAQPIDASAGIVMLPVLAPGEKAVFTMGATGLYAHPDQKPAHPVTLTVPYAMGRHEITAGQFCRVMNWALEKGYARIVDGNLKDPSGVRVYLGVRTVDRFSQEGIAVKEGRLAPREIKLAADGSAAPGADFPAHAVSWYGAAAFCNFLSEQEGLPPVYDLDRSVCDWSKKGYRLPTEAEWTYAAKGNTGRLYPWGDEIDGTYCSCELARRLFTTCFFPVGFFDGKLKHGLATHDNASPCGLSDMAGNVWELCWDWYGESYFKNSPPLDPRGPAKGDIPSDRYPRTDTPTRVWKGGGYENDESYLNVNTRWSSDPNLTYQMLGFRIAKTL